MLTSAQVTTSVDSCSTRAGERTIASDGPISPEIGPSSFAGKFGPSDFAGKFKFSPSDGAGETPATGLNGPRTRRKLLPWKKAETRVLKRARAVFGGRGPKDLLRKSLMSGDTLPLMRSGGAMRKKNGALDRASRDWLEARAADPLILNHGETDPCDPVSVVEICGEHHEKTRVYACTRRKCSTPACVRHALMERTRLIRPLMLESFRGEWGVLVLGYVPEARELLRRPTWLKAARQLAGARIQSLILQMNGLDPDSGWRLGMVSVDHPEGDKQPGVWKPHHNLLFPTVAFHPSGERRELRYFLEEEELAILRNEWAYLQEQVMGHKLHREADIWYQFRRGKAHKSHAIKYFPRTFQTWGARAQQLSYLGAFGCSVIHQLPEVAALKAKVKQDVEDLKRCTVCKKEIVKRICSQHAVPMHFRATFGGSSPP